MRPKTLLHLSMLSRVANAMLLNLLLVLPAIACSTYALNDKHLNLSQLLCLEPAPDGITLLQEYPTADLEGIALHPDNGLLYLISSSDATGWPVGELYHYNPQNTLLTSVGNTGYSAIDSLAFCGTTLYGWARGAGLVEIDVETAATELVLAATEDVEGLTCDADGILYGAYGTQLLRYDGNDVSLLCDLPATTETLEVLEENSLLLGLHSGTDILQLDLQSCTTTQFVETAGYRDIEGLAVELPQCILFDDFRSGQKVTGADVVYPGLTITGAEGSNLRVIKERQSPGIYSSNGIMNNCLGQKGVGFGDVNRKHGYSFTFDKPVKYFSLWMHDFGDYNPYSAKFHSIFLEGFDAADQRIAIDKLRYKLNNKNNASRGGVNLTDGSSMGNIAITGDACSAEIGDVANRMFAVSGDAMTEVVLRFDNDVRPGRASDTHFAISALCFSFAEEAE